MIILMFVRPKFKVYQKDLKLKIDGRPIDFFTLGLPKQLLLLKETLVRNPWLPV